MTPIIYSMLTMVYGKHCYDLRNLEFEVDSETFDRWISYQREDLK
jgi:hypothetical protein